MRASLNFGRILGIPIGAHSSWLIVFVLDLLRVLQTRAELGI
jgi:hypothetical protein